MQPGKLSKLGFKMTYAGRSPKLCSFAAGLLLVTALVGLGVLHAQPPVAAPAESQKAPAPELPKFDVASIKPSAPDSRGLMLMMTPTGLRMNGAQIQTLLQLAFGVEPDRIVGAPDWVRSRRYEIEAKVKPEDAPKLAKLTMEQKRPMMLRLLEERFGLKYHRESRQLPIYALVVAKGGPKLTESKPGEAMPGPDGRTGRPGDLTATPGVTPSGSGSMAKFDGSPGMRNRPVIGEGMKMDAGGIQSRGGNTAFLAHALSGIVGRSVVDKTGLTGKYDFSLNWTPDQSMREVEGGPQGEAPPDAVGPSIFTALQEQLGLKLESQKGAVDVIVIDRIDPPTEN